MIIFNENGSKPFVGYLIIDYVYYLSNGVRNPSHQI